MHPAATRGDAGAGSGAARHAGAVHRLPGPHWPRIDWLARSRARRPGALRRRHGVRTHLLEALHHFRSRWNDGPRHLPAYGRGPVWRRWPRRSRSWAQNPFGHPKPSHRILSGDGLSRFEARKRLAGRHHFARRYRAQAGHLPRDGTQNLARPRFRLARLAGLHGDGFRSGRRCGSRRHRGRGSPSKSGAQRRSRDCGSLRSRPLHTCHGRRQQIGGRWAFRSCFFGWRRRRYGRARHRGRGGRRGRRHNGGSLRYGRRIHRLVHGRPDLFFVVVTKRRYLRIRRSRLERRRQQ